MIYPTNIQHLLAQLVPRPLRDAITLAWLRVLLAASARRMAALTDAMQRWLLAARWTGQTAVLEHALDTLYGPGITITHEDLSPGEMVSWFADEGQTDSAFTYAGYEGQPDVAFSFHGFEILGAYRFVVNVPTALASDEAAIRATVERHRSVGAKYIINFI